MRRRVYSFYASELVVYVVYVVELLSKKQQQISTRARRGSPSLFFSLSKTIKVVFFWVSPSSSQKSEKKESTVSRVFVFLQNTDTKKTQKIKILPLLLFYSSTNDNINIKTVWRAWMNSKSPKAEETKGTEI